MRTDILYLPKQRRKSYKIGNRFMVCAGSGLASDKYVTIIHKYNWKYATDGTYRTPGNDQVPVRYDDGTLGFMYKDRLLWPPEDEISKEKVDQNMEVLSGGSFWKVS